MKTLKLIVVVVLAVTITACCACRRGKSGITITGTEWHLAQLNGTGITSDNYRMTLEEDGSIGGIGDCNRFTGTYTISDKAIGIGKNLVSTRMMCLNQTREAEFFKMLADIDSYSIDGNRLMLIKGGNVLAIFDPTTPKTEAEAEATK